MRAVELEGEAQESDWTAELVHGGTDSEQGNGLVSEGPQLLADGGDGDHHGDIDAGAHNREDEEDEG